MKLYALHDKKAQAFSSFHVERSDAQATRGFADAVMKPDSVFGKYPEDFELVAVCDVHDTYKGQLDDHVVVSPIACEVVVTAAQIVALQAKAAPDGQLSLLKEA